MDWALYHPAIVSLIVTVLAAMILRWLQPKAKIIWSELYGFTYLVTNDNDDKLDGNIWTRSMIVQNIGKETASGVEVIFNFQPGLYNIWPSLPHTTESLPDKRFVIRANSLAAKEWFRIELLSYDELPSVVRVRTAATGEASNVPMMPMRVFPKPILFMILAAMFLGIFSIIYHAVSFAFSALSG